MSGSSSRVELWEFQGPQVLHAKAALVDGRLAYVGSFNLDPRAQELNSETGVVVEGPELASDLARFVAEVQERSLLVARDGTLDRSRWRKPHGVIERLMWPLLRTLARIPLVRNQL